MCMRLKWLRMQAKNLQGAEEEEEQSRGVCQSACVQGALNTTTVHSACRRMWCIAFRHSFIVLAREVVEVAPSKTTVRKVHHGSNVVSMLDILVLCVDLCTDAAYTMCV